MLKIIVEYPFFIESWIRYDDFDKNFNIDYVGYLYRNNLKSLNVGISLNSIKNVSNISEASTVLQYIKSKNYNNVKLKEILSIDWQAKLFNNWFDVKILGISK